MSTEAEKIHGKGNCHICGKPKRLPSDASSACSYPHGMVPDQKVTEGMWSWKTPEKED